MVDNVSKPFTFEANTYAKASEVNADFDVLYSGLNAGINQINTNTTNITNVGSNKADKAGDSSQQFNVANPTADNNAVNLATLKAMYPVGSIYIGVMSTCPMSSLFGTWEKIASDRVLQSSSSSHSAGTTIAAGLPNITGEVENGPYYNAAKGAFNSTNSSSYRLGGGEASGGSSYKATFNAHSSNSIYGNSSTVQPPAYVVNIWRRTA